MKTPKDILHSVLLLAVWLTVFGLFSPWSAFARQNCETAFRQALAEYDIGRFDRVKELLADCPKYAGAHELLALSYIAVDRLEKARESIDSLLVQEPDYEPNKPLNYPAIFRNLILINRLALAKAHEDSALKLIEEPEPKHKEARNEITELLEIYARIGKTYTPPSSLKKLVEEIRAKVTKQRKSLWSKPWFLLGGGALAATIPLVLFTKGKTATIPAAQPIPGPPNLPPPPPGN